LNVSDQDTLIGLIARYDPMKDHDNFLKAASFLARDNPSVHFVLVGYKVDKNNKTIMRTINESGHEGHFHLLGERGDIPRIIPALDIVTSSSSSEGFPNTIGEAMACGVPCVVTDVGDSALLVGDTGKVVPPRNPQSLADGWREIIELGNEDQRRLGMAARRRIEKEFTLPAVVARYEEFYQQAIANVRYRRI
jgi:glycosyltransferase involved in cell wall biosynthesis